MHLRKHRDGLGDEASLESATVNDGESLTQQQYAEQVDVNTLVRRFGVSGVLPVARDAPKFGDFPIMDLHVAMNVVTSTREAFDRLPATVRSRFQNDPRVLWEWMQDPENDAEAVRLGLFTAKPEAPAEQEKKE